MWTFSRGGYAHNPRQSVNTAAPITAAAAVCRYGCRWWDTARLCVVEATRMNPHKTVRSMPECPHGLLSPTNLPPLRVQHRSRHQLFGEQAPWPIWFGPARAKPNTIRTQYAIPYRSLMVAGWTGHLQLCFDHQYGLQQNPRQGRFVRRDPATCRTGWHPELKDSTGAHSHTEDA